MQTANYVKVNTYLGTIEKSQCLGEMITLNYDVPLALIWDITPESAHLLLRLIRLVLFFIKSQFVFLHKTII